MYCWLSVSIKRGANALLTRNLLRLSIANWTFVGQLLAVVNCWPGENITRVAVSKFVDPVHNLLYISIKLIWSVLWHVLLDVLYTQLPNE